MCVGRLTDNPSPKCVVSLGTKVFLKVRLRRRDEISKNYQMRIATRATLALIRRCNRECPGNFAVHVMSMDKNNV